MVQNISLLRAIARKLLLVGAILTILSVNNSSTDGWQSSARAEGTQTASDVSDDPYLVTRQYVIDFYPLWFTYYQSSHANKNRLLGPERMTPAFHEVVAPNDDTLYVSTFMNLIDQPTVLTIPASTGKVTASLLTLDEFGNVFSSGIDPKTPGTYLLIGPSGFSGTIPSGLTPVDVPFAFSSWLIRADKFSPTGEDQTADAETFRKELIVQTLSQYESQPRNTTFVAPDQLYRLRFKQIADSLTEHHAIEFLRQLQVAVAAPNTPPLTAEEKALTVEFNVLFGNGKFDLKTDAGRELRSKFIAGTQAAHDLIVADYVTHTDLNNWISFTNIGNWGTDYLDRAAITEFIQYGNGFDTAAYFQAFEDGDGARLNGHGARVYLLKFGAHQIPQAERFWSVTAYIPNSITLFRNKLNKYLVGSYTPGLQTDADGSISIYVSSEQPNGVPQANWLPVPKGEFSLMLRVYGPGANVSSGDYHPPALMPVSP